MLNQNVNVTFSYWAFKNEIQLSVPCEEMKPNVVSLIEKIKEQLVQDELTIRDAFLQLFDDILKIGFASLGSIDFNNLNLNDFSTKIYRRFENRDLPEDLEPLNENVLFSLRTKTRIYRDAFNKVSDKGSFSSIENLSKSILQSEPAAQAPYSFFIKFLSNIPHGNSTRYIDQTIDFFTSSLYIELGIIAADIIYDHQDVLNLSENRIDELSELIVENTQLFASVVIEWTSTKSSIKENVEGDLANDEDLLLAELGLNEFFKNIEK